MRMPECCEIGQAVVAPTAALFTWLYYLGVEGRVRVPRWMGSGMGYRGVNGREPEIAAWPKVWQFLQQSIAAYRSQQAAPTLLVG